MTTPRPTPGMMPRRRPEIRADPARVTPSTFAADPRIPQCGTDDATVWPDTGVLLAAGSDAAVPVPFRTRYKARALVAGGVDNEVRGRCFVRPPADAPDEDHLGFEAAERAVQEFLLPGTGLVKRAITPQDFAAVDAVRVELDARSPAAGKGKHTGEAQIIVLAERERDRTGRTQVLLTNDGGASVVARQHGLSSRHAADVLRELVCAGVLDPESSWGAHETALAVTRMPAHVRPRRGAFTCARVEGACQRCDA